MVKDNNYIDVEFESNDKFYTITDVSKITELEESEIIFYYNKFNDFLKIQAVGMYQIFSDEDIKNLMKLKDLRNKNMSVSDIKKYLKENKNEILLEKPNDKTIDVSFLHFIAKIFEVQNDKIEKVLDVNTELLNVLNNKLNNNLIADPNNLEEVKKEIDKKFDERFDNVDKLLESKLESFTNDVKQEIKFAYAKKEEIEKMTKKRSFLDKILRK